MSHNDNGYLEADFERLDFSDAPERLRERDFLGLAGLPALTTFSDGDGLRDFDLFEFSLGLRGDFAVEPTDLDRLRDLRSSTGGEGDRE